MKRDKGWAALLQQAVATRERKPTGEGWSTIKEVQEQLNMGRGRAYEFLAREIKKGTVERFVGSEDDGTGRLVRTSYYRMVR